MSESELGFLGLMDSNFDIEPLLNPSLLPNSDINLDDLPSYNWNG